MRSARHGTIAVVGLSMLAGCATTQQQAARLQLNDARVRASQLPLRLVGRNRTVSVMSVALITGRHSAVIVMLRNAGPRPVSDLPLLVGASSRGRRTYLNRAANVGYFQNHVPAIPAHGSLRWVLTLDHGPASSSRLFAEVGIAAGSTSIPIRTLPMLRVSGEHGLVKVENLSGVTQYQLPVYAIAVRGGRYVAAGQATIADLGGGATTQIRMPIVGDSSGAALALEAPPTIFN